MNNLEFHLAIGLEHNGKINVRHDLFHFNYSLLFSH